MEFPAELGAFLKKMLSFPQREEPYAPQGGLLEELLRSSGDSEANF